jgi:NAD(P)-dependent dehydrogenase (short-subunit alcohol dehydrogenase family)
MKGKVAIVTGSGGGGTGRATARRFAREGALIVVNDVSESGGRETAELIENEGGRAAFFRADIGNETEVRALIAFAESTYRRSGHPGQQRLAPGCRWTTGRVDRYGAHRAAGADACDAGSDGCHAPARWRSHRQYRFDFRARPQPQAFTVAQL